MRNERLWLGLVSLLLLLAVLPACKNSSSDLTEDDRSGIYAAVVRQVYTVDHTFGVGNSPSFLVVYILRSTDDTAGDPRSTGANSQPIKETIQAAVATALDDLLVEFVWVDNRDEVPMDRGEVAGRGAIITLGNTYPQEDGSVQVAAGLFFASTGGGGTTYIVEQVDGIWQITGTTGVRWIS